MIKPILIAAICASICLGCDGKDQGSFSEIPEPRIEQQVETAPDAVEPGPLELYPTWNAVGLEISYSGDKNDNTRPVLFWRKPKDKHWRNGVEMTVDRQRHLIWASIYPLEPGEEIEIRVLFPDPSSTFESSLEGRMKTKEMVVEPEGGKTYFVSPGGSDEGPGTREKPFQTLAHAAGIARPGDIVYAMSGVYREGDLLAGLKGTAERPIVFAAAEGQKPILDSSIEIPKHSGVWKQYQGEIYVTTLGQGLKMVDSTDFGYVALEGERMFRYTSLKDLVTDRLNVPRAWFLNPATKELYVRTGRGYSARYCSLSVARHRFALLLSGSEFVVLRGFEIRNYGQAAVQIIDGARGCIIIDNVIHNAPNGVFLDGVETRDNAIWRNKVYEPGLVDIPWNSIKASGYPRQGIFAGVAGRGNSINCNTVHGWFDGICVESWLHPEDIEVNRDTDVMYNLVYNIGDDGFELDGGGVNLRLHGNKIRNVLVAISLAPIERGPTYVTRNDATFWSMMFKLNVGGCTSLGPTCVYHNSGYGLNSGNGFGMIGLTAIAYGGIEVRNKVFMNNAMIGADKAVRAGADGNYLDYNSYWHTPGKWPRLFEWNGVLYKTIEEFHAATGQEEHGLYADPRFADTPDLGRFPWKGFGVDQIGNYPLAPDADVGDFSLGPESPLIDRGAVIPGINDDYAGEGPDIGAFEFYP